MKRGHKEGTHTTGRILTKSDICVMTKYFFRSSSIDFGIEGRYLRRVWTVRFASNVRCSCFGSSGLTFSCASSSSRRTTCARLSGRSLPSLTFSSKCVETGFGQVAKLLGARVRVSCAFRTGKHGIVSEVVVGSGLEVTVREQQGWVRHETERWRDGEKRHMCKHLFHELEPCVYVHTHE